MGFRKNTMQANDLDTLRSDSKMRL